MAHKDNRRSPGFCLWVKPPPSADLLMKLCLCLKSVTKFLSRFFKARARVDFGEW